MIDAAFGAFHEAYVDNKGKLYVCKKAKMSSVKVENRDDGDRKDLTEVRLPRGKAIQAQFTRYRMFVLTNLGEVYVTKIEEMTLDSPSRSIKSQQENIEATVMVDSLQHVKDLKGIKQIACGNDHFLALDKNGQVFAMGDDTFG